MKVKAGMHVDILPGAGIVKPSKAWNDIGQLSNSDRLEICLSSLDSCNNENLC